MRGIEVIKATLDQSAVSETSRVWLWSLVASPSGWSKTVEITTPKAVEPDSLAERAKQLWDESLEELRRTVVGWRGYSPQTFGSFVRFEINPNEKNPAGAVIVVQIVYAHGAREDVSLPVDGPDHIGPVFDEWMSKRQFKYDHN